MKFRSVVTLAITLFISLIFSNQSRAGDFHSPRVLGNGYDVPILPNNYGMNKPIEGKINICGGEFLTSYFISHSSAVSVSNIDGVSSLSYYAHNGYDSCWNKSQQGKLEDFERLLIDEMQMVTERLMLFNDQVNLFIVNSADFSAINFIKTLTEIQRLAASLSADIGYDYYYGSYEYLLKFPFSDNTLNVLEGIFNQVNWSGLRTKLSMWLFLIDGRSGTPIYFMNEYFELDKLVEFDLEAQRYSVVSPVYLDLVNKMSALVDKYSLKSFALENPEYLNRFDKVREQIGSIIKRYSL